MWGLIWVILGVIVGSKKRTRGEESERGKIREEERTEIYTRKIVGSVR